MAPEEAGSLRHSVSITGYTITISLLNKYLTARYIPDILNPTAEGARRYLVDITNKSPGWLHVVLDLTHVEFMDSTGIGAILIWYRQFNKSLKIIASEPLYRIFKDLNICDILNIVRGKDINNITKE